MQARDVMVSPVITVGKSATVRDVAKVLLEKRISAVSVVDGVGEFVGIVTEGDLIYRAETGTERPYSWWTHFSPVRPRVLLRRRRRRNCSSRPSILSLAADKNRHVGHRCLRAFPDPRWTSRWGHARDAENNDGADSDFPLNRRRDRAPLWGQFLKR